MSALAMILTAAMVVPRDMPEKVSGEMLQESKPSFQIRQYPKDGQPWNRGEAILVRLDIHRMRAYNLTSYDVMNACIETSMIVGSRRRVDPPPGVIFNTHFIRPEQYENLIVRATPDGEIVRLKDVAKVEVDR